MSSFLSDYFQKAKKKLYDTFEPVEQKVSSGLGQAYNSAKNYLSDTAHNVENYVAPRIQSFDDNYAKPAADFFKQNPTPYSYVAPKMKDYFNNDATVGGIVKNTFKPSNLADALMKVPEHKFTFADKVSWRNPVVKLPAELVQGAANTFHNVTDYAREAADQYYGNKKYDLGSLAGKGLGAALDLGGLAIGGGEGEKLLKTGAKTVGERMAPSLKSAIWQGAKDTSKIMGRFGAGYSLADSLKNHESLPQTALNVAQGYAGGRIAGGVIGGGLPAVSAGTKALTHDLKVKFGGKNYGPVDAIPARTVETNREPLYSGNGYMFTPKKLPAQEFNPNAPQFPDVFKQIGEALPRPGMTIQEVPKARPKTSAELNASIAQKRARAQETVNKQIENQKAGLPTAEPGFVVPQAVPAPAPKKPLPSIEEFVNGKTEVKKPLPSIEEFVNGKAPKVTTPKDVFETKPYNKFQQRAYDKKVERTDALRDVLNYPNELRKIGYKKAEISRIGKDEADKIIKLGNLGYPKNEIQKIKYDNKKLDAIIEKNVPFSSWKEYNQKMRALKTNFLDGIDPMTLKDINPVMIGNRDIYRNTKAVFGESYPIIKNRLLDPFDQAKGQNVDYQRQWASDLMDNVVNKFGIKMKTPEAMAIVNHGENKLLRLPEESDMTDIIKQQINLPELQSLAEKTKTDWRMLAARKLEEMPDERKQVVTQQLQQIFPEKWQNIIEAEKWFRNAYDSILERTNSVYSETYPTNPLFPESSKIIPRRNDYFRHGKNFSDGFEGIKNLFETPYNIDPSLAAISEFTEPKSKWLSFAQKRKGDANELDAIAGFLDYLKASSYAQHIDPFIQKFRGADIEAEKLARPGEYFHKTDGLAEELGQKFDPIHQITEAIDPSKIKSILTDHGISDAQSEWMSKELANMSDYGKVKDFLKNKLAKNSGDPFGKMVPKAAAEGADNKLNRYLRSLTLFTNDLAGKTNSLDRPMMDFIDRKGMSAIDMVNRRVKANSIGFNIASGLSQGVNIAQGFADANPVNSIKGIKDAISSIFTKNSPINQSAFVKERFFNDYNKFDTGILNNTKKFGFWIVGVLDEAGTKLIWHAEHNKALANGIPDPIKFADDQTRNLVAGRGIGEMPVFQKAKTMQLVAPFQLEVQNLWHVFHDWKVDKKLIPKLIQYSIYAYLYNEMKKKIAGSRVTLDPINAGIEAYKLYSNEDDKTKGVGMATGRLAGEVLKNIPGGGLVSSTIFSPETSKKYLGDSDPNRYGAGAGLILGSGLIKKDIFTADGLKKTGADLAAKLALPSGGRQIQKIYDGGKSIMQGYTENSAGNVMTPVDKNIPNIMKGVLFGKNALGEMQTYFDNKQTPLSKEQTEKFKIGGGGYYDSVVNSRNADNEKEKLKKAADSGKKIEGPGDLGGGVHRLTDGNYYVPNLLADTKTFKTEKLARYAIDREDFMNSEDKMREHDGEFWYKKNGEFKLETKDERDKKIATAKANLDMDRAQGTDNLKAWGEAANRKIKAIDDYLSKLDPAIDQDTIDSLTLEKENLLDKAEKFAEYGGFKKPKKGAKLEEKYRYPSLVDPEMLKIQALIAGTGRRKPIIGKRAMPLIVRRLPVVHRSRRRR